NSGEISNRSPRSTLKRAFGGSGGGSRNFTNLSIYAFGLSGVWTGVGAGILPFKVLEALDAGRVEIIGYSLDKNGALGIISLVGLVIAAVAQLAAGALSDRDSRPGKRLPYILMGMFGLAVITVLFGLATSFVMLLAAIVAMQLFGNIGQGPANALIVDHVPARQRGQAAGVLNLWRLLGAGLLTVIVLQFMSRYDAEDSPEWIWYSIALMVVVLIITTIWTVVKIKPPGGLFFPALRPSSKWHKLRTDESPLMSKVPKAPISRSYLAFLVALGFAIAAMSSMQIYALFFLQDVVGLKNPADGADKLVVVIVVSAGLTVLPAGYLADRLGRTNLFILAGAAGITSSLLLLFVSSIGPVLAVGVVIGIAVGLFMTLTWAVANDLVSNASAARELGYTSLATLGGAAAARLAGIGIDELNNVSENLGYKAILIAVAVAFAISTIILTKITKKPEAYEIGSDLEPVTSVQAPD
ncbi:MAG: MFS transporter, partial [Dehalococcoidia bacterium]